jgi:hypothetical protein
MKPSGHRDALSGVDRTPESSRRTRTLSGGCCCSAGHNQPVYAAAPDRPGQARAQRLPRGGSQATSIQVRRAEGGSSRGRGNGDTRMTPLQQLESLRKAARWFWHESVSDDDLDPFVVPGYLLVNGEVITATLSLEAAQTSRDPNGSVGDNRSLGHGTSDKTDTCARFRLTARVADELEDSLDLRERSQRAGISLAGARAEFDAETRVLNVRSDGRWDPIAAPTRSLVHDVFADFRRLIQNANLAIAVAVAKGRWCLKSRP